MRYSRPLVSKKAATELLAEVNAASDAYTALVKARPMDPAAVERARESYLNKLVELHGALRYYANGCRSSAECAR